MEKIVIWGASGHALVVADILRLNRDYDIVGFLDDQDRERKGQPFGGALVLGGTEELERLAGNGVRHLIVAIGDCGARWQLGSLAKEKGFRLGSAVHPGATIAGDSVFGAGSVMAAGSIVGPATNIGESVIVNTGATVDHECRIGSATHVGPGAHLGGRVVVGERTWIGIGAAIVDRITVGSDAVVGAGSVVTRPVPDGVVSYGVPARTVRKIAEPASRRHRGAQE